MQHYFISKIPNGKLEECLALVEITRRVKAGEISGEYVATESTGPSYNALIQQPNVIWRSVAQLVSAENQPPVSGETLRSAPPAPSPKRSSQPVHLRIEFWACIGLLLFFFMPWVSIFNAGMAGYQVADILSRTQSDAPLSVLIYLIPILAGLCLMAELVTGGRASSGLYLLAGLLPLIGLGYAFTKMGETLFSILSVGGWATVAAGTVCILGALSTAHLRAAAR